MLYYTLKDQQMIARADVFAATMHAGQTRKDGTPYIEHPRYVSALAGYWAQLLLDEDRSTNMLVLSRIGEIRLTGLCHDLMEDQDISYQELSDLFSPTVAGFVQCLTIDHCIEEKEKREQEYCSRLWVSCIDVQLCKLADIYHNSISTPPNPKFGAKWVKKAYKMLEALDKVKYTIYHAHTARVLRDREVYCGGNISRTGMVSGGECGKDQNQEVRPVDGVKEEPSAAC